MSGLIPIAVFLTVRLLTPVCPVITSTISTVDEPTLVTFAKRNPRGVFSDYDIQGFLADLLLEFRSLVRSTLGGDEIGGNDCEKYCKNYDAADDGRDCSAPPSPVFSDEALCRV